MSRHCHFSGFGIVLELPVTAAGFDLIPTVFLQTLHDITYLQRASPGFQMGGPLPTRRTLSNSYEIVSENARVQANLKGNTKEDVGPALKRFFSKHPEV